MKNDCIIAEGCKDKGGYGYKRHNGKNWKAHRWAYTQAHGHIPKGQVVRHRCHNPACINPDHLVLGTQADNMQDMVDADRQSRGETHGLAKLTEDQAREIYASNPNNWMEWNFKDISAKDLANKYGVSRLAIHNIWRKRTWQHIHSK